MAKAMTWEQICDDPNLRDLPYKIEQDRHGRIVMSPTNAAHGRYPFEVARWVCALLPEFTVPVECPIETSEGLKVPDVAAMNRELDRLYRSAVSLPRCA
jgi:hypothetical protein